MSIGRSLLVDAGPLCAALLLRPTLATLTSAVFLSVRTAADRRFLRPLPCTAGDWVRQRLHAHPALRPIEVVTTPAANEPIDAYFPSGQLIQLSPETWLRQDGVGLATAAHEVGHAVHYRTHPRLARVWIHARWIGRAVWVIAASLLLTNRLFASPLLADLGLVALILAILSAALVLIDEGWASRTGWQLLEAEPWFGGDHRDAAYTTMGAAFLSYAGALVGTLAVLPYAADGPKPVLDVATMLAGFAATWRTSIAESGLTALVGARALYAAWKQVTPTRYATPPEAELGAAWANFNELAWTAPLTAWLTLQFDPQRGNAFALAFAIAAIPAFQGIFRWLSPLISMALLPVLLVVLPFIAWALPRETEARPLPSEAMLERLRFELERGDRAIRAANLSLSNTPPLHVRLGQLARVAHVPLLLLRAWT